MGFPGECDEDYQGQIALLPSLYHLARPAGCGRIWLERFSPYFEDPTLGIVPARPARSYPYVYPIEGIELRRIAYYFEYQARTGASARSMRQLHGAVGKWRAAAEDASLPPTLSMSRGTGFVVLTDTRFGEIRRATLRGWRAAIYDLCGVTAISPARAAMLLEKETGQVIDSAAAEQFLQACVAKRLSVHEAGRYLSLALPTRQILRGGPAGKILDHLV